MKSAAITSRSTWKRFSSFLPFNTAGVSDKLLLFVSISLAAFGLVMVYSASYIFAQEKYGDGLYYFNHHLIFLVMGFMAMLFLRFFRLSLLHKLALPIFLVALGLIDGYRMFEHAGDGFTWWDYRMNAFKRSRLSSVSGQATLSSGSSLPSSTRLLLPKT